MGDSKACSNVVRLKATEDYLLGFATLEEKEKWTEHYFMLRFKSKPRRGIRSPLKVGLDEPLNRLGGSVFLTEADQTGFGRCVLN